MIIQLKASKQGVKFLNLEKTKAVQAAIKKLETEKWKNQ